MLLQCCTINHVYQGYYNLSIQYITVRCNYNGLYLHWKFGVFGLFNNQIKMYLPNSHCVLLNLESIRKQFVDLHTWIVYYKCLCFTTHSNKLDITEILLKVASNTINQTKPSNKLELVNSIVLQLMHICSVCHNYIICYLISVSLLRAN